MKIKEGYLLRDVAGNHVVVPVGKVDFDGMIRLNETGAFLWEKLQSETDPATLTKELCKEYNVEALVAEKDVESFLSKLRGAGLLNE